MVPIPWAAALYISTYVVSISRRGDEDESEKLEEINHLVCPLLFHRYKGKA